MVRIYDTLWCEGCGAEIAWAPYIIEGRDFCCQDCCRGMACGCGDRMIWEDDRRTKGEQHVYTQDGAPASLLQ